MATVKIIALMLAICSVASAADIYFAQSATGANNGTSCANAYSVTRFNTADSNWTPGNTLHVCGTYTGSANTTMLTTQGNGSSGNPITIKFETGALLQAPYWSVNGAITGSNNYITIDGGTNGTIENTLNGTTGGACIGGTCNTQQASSGVVLSGSNVIVKNLIVTHIYVKTEGTNDDAGDANQAIQTQGSNSQVTRCTIDNVYTGIVNGGTNISGIEFDHNTLMFCNHCLKSAITSGTVTGLSIHDNNVSSMYNWDQPDNHYHHNGIFVFGDPAGTHSNAVYYNNYIHGLNSRDAVYGATHITGLIFLEFANPGATVFNNVLQLDPDGGGTQLNYPADGYVTEGGAGDSGASYYYNNTIVGGDNGGNCLDVGSTNAVTVHIKNNITSNCGNPIFVGSSAILDIDYNAYSGISGDAWVIGGAQYSIWTNWQAACACDSHSGTPPVSLNLNGSPPPYTLTSGSAAIGTGVNLTSAGIAAINTGAPYTFGTSGACGGGCLLRDPFSAWDIGAYPFNSATFLPGAIRSGGVCSGGIGLC